MDEHLSSGQKELSSCGNTSDLAAENPGGDQLYLVDESGEHHISCAGKIGYPFFGELILDCLNRTQKAMTQEHAFKAAELCLEAQARAVRLH